MAQSVSFLNYQAAYNRTSQEEERGKNSRTEKFLAFLQI